LWYHRVKIMGQKYRLVHDQMLITYLMQYYPWGTYRLNPRLGVLSPELREVYGPKVPLRWLQNWLARADAIAILPEEVHILECIARPNEWWKIEMLDQYEQLFRVTEEYREHWEKPIRKLLLTAVRNPFMEARAAARQIRVIEWRPPEIEFYYGTIAGRRRTPHLSAL